MSHPLLPAALSTAQQSVQTLLSSVSPALSSVLRVPLTLFRLVVHHPCSQACFSAFSYPRFLQPLRRTHISPRIRTCDSIIVSRRILYPRQFSHPPALFCLPSHSSALLPAIRLNNSTTLLGIVCQSFVDAQQPASLTSSRSFMD